MEPSGNPASEEERSVARGESVRLRTNRRMRGHRVRLLQILCVANLIRENKRRGPGLGAAMPEIKVFRGWGSQGWINIGGKRV